MFMFPSRLRCYEAAMAGMIICIGVMSAAFAQSIPLAYTGIGRTATPAEIKAWDIDVRPDFKGLPPGAGSVANGQQIWETKCESHHVDEANAIIHAVGLHQPRHALERTQIFDR